MSRYAALWLAFNQARDALLSAIEAPISCAPVVLEQPAKRSEARLRVQDTVEELSQALAEIDITHKRLSEASVAVQRRRIQAQSLLAPVNCLPTEILLEIFGHILGPEDPCSIIRLSSVCDSWRRIILEQTALFTHANWSRWPTWLLKLWTSRAQSRLLTVEIGEPIESKFSNEPGDPDFLTLLSETASRWRALRVAPIDVDQWVVPPSIVTHLLALPTLSLQTLHFDVGTSVLPYYREMCAPNIGTIFVRGLHLRPVQGFPQLSSLAIEPRLRDVWSLWTDLLSLSPSLTRLKITISQHLDVDTNGRSLVLPALESLTVVEETLGTVARFITIMDSSSFPNLRIVHMTGLIGPALGPPSVLDSMSRCSPNLKFMTIENTASRPSSGFMVLMLRGLARNPLHLQHLSHISLKDAVHDLRQFYPIYERELFRVTDARNLEHLSIPLLARDRAGELELRVGSVKVIEWLEGDGNLPRRPR